MKLRYLVKKIATTPPQVLIKKSMSRLRSSYQKKQERHVDLNNSTYQQTITLDKPLTCFTPAFEIEDFTNIDEIREVTNLYLDHYFEVLGSGWAQQKHGMKCRGVEGHLYEAGEKTVINAANLAESEAIRKLLSTNYIAIDWQLDFKSGYRWREDTWYKDISYGHLPGVDIKVPWELARMHHLTQLAFAYYLAKQGLPGFKAPEIYVSEFRNQIMDFIAANPPRFGVNWFCSMDVAIRASNWLIAYDLFQSFGATFDQEFVRIFSRSIYEHGDHVFNNLEWFGENRSNHYLANIVGLLYIAAYLNYDNEWLDFSVKEFIQEVDFHFYEEGSNFEASTSYHRLSAEIVLYGAAIILAIPEVGARLPAWVFERLEKIALFTVSITKPNKQIPQFGDNDNGRFFKLEPNWQCYDLATVKKMYQNLEGYSAGSDTYWFEDHLDHRALVGGYSGLFDRKDFVDFSESFTVDRKIIAHMVKGFKQEPHEDQSRNRWISEVDFEQFELTEVPFIKSEFMSGGGNLLDRLEGFSYPEFGLYIYKSTHLYLAIRCGSNGQNGNGGHAHNDQLSIELTINGEDIIKDPGTYLYTPLPEKRNLFRSTKSHFTPQCHGKEQNSWVEGLNGLFHLKNEAQAKCLHFSEQGFIGVHHGFGFPVHRKITLYQDRIEICDYGEKIEAPQIPTLYSDGYGSLRR